MSEWSEFNKLSYHRNSLRTLLRIYVYVTQFQKEQKKNHQHGANISVGAGSCFYEWLNIIFKNSFAHSYFFLKKFVYTLFENNELLYLFHGRFLSFICLLIGEWSNKLFLWNRSLNQRNLFFFCIFNLHTNNNNKIRNNNFYVALK